MRLRTTNHRATHKILRHWEPVELANGTAWAARADYDGFVCHLRDDDSAAFGAVQNLVAAGKLFFRYFATVNYPYGVWDFGATPRLQNYLRHNWQFVGSSTGAAGKYRMLVTGSPNKVVLLYFGASPNGTRYEVIPWPLFADAEVDAVAAKMVTFASDLYDDGSSFFAPGGGLFCDQSWLGFSDWEMGQTATSSHGDTKETAPYLGPVLQSAYSTIETLYGDGGSWSTWRSKTQRFYAALASGLAATPKAKTPLGPVTPYRLTNGEWRTVGGETIPFPWYIENAWESNLGNYATAVSHWRGDPRNVLSVICGLGSGYAGPTAALADFATYGGWIAFTDTGANGEQMREQAYRDAARIRAGY